jgi:hypothetical protein
MKLANRQAIEESIEQADKSFAVLNTYAMGYGLSLANWESFAEDAENTFIGYFGSDRTFAENYAERIGLLNSNGNGQIETLARYFNFDSWATSLLANKTVWKHEGYYFENLS